MTALDLMSNLRQEQLVKISASLGEKHQADTNLVVIAFMLVNFCDISSHAQEKNDYAERASYPA